MLIKCGDIHIIRSNKLVLEERGIRMAIIIDIILAGLFLLTVIRHARLGLVCSVLSAGRFIFSVVAALVLCYPVGALANAAGVPDALSGIAAFVVVFIFAMLLSKLLVNLLSKVRIPLITKVDKLLGFLLGVILGAVIISISATTVYTVIELIAKVNSESDAMSIYTDSYVFKFVYDLKLFEFVRNLF